MATIMGISFHFTGTAWHISNGVIRCMESLGYLNDSLTTLIVPHSVTDRENASALEIKDATLSFKDVGFEYDSKPVFEGLNLDIPNGQRVGLIGPSGAGKSTLINLIPTVF